MTLGIGVTSNEPETSDAEFENLVDNFDREPEIDERREMRESLQP